MRRKRNMMKMIMRIIRMILIAMMTITIHSILGENNGREMLWWEYVIRGEYWYYGRERGLKMRKIRVIVVMMIVIITIHSILEKERDIMGVKLKIISFIHSIRRKFYR